MPYIDASGNVVDKKPSFIEYILSFFSVLILFFKSMFGLDSSTSDPNSNRDHLRRSNGGGGRWPGSGGPGGPGRAPQGGGGPRRQIGRLATGSGMSCPPMAGGG